MSEGSLLALFLVGFLGGTHCMAMCGGIVGALSLSSAAKTRSWQTLALQLAYNGGRISSYTLAGALLGALGGLSLLMDHVLPVERGLYWLANLLLIAMGLYIIGQTRYLAWLERGGQHLWRYIQPLTRRFLPARTVLQAWPLGMLWGFLPCGMVYSALASALLAGRASDGAALMLAFGLGTLPNLLLAGLLWNRVGKLSKNRWLRLISGLLVLAYGLYGLFQIPHPEHHAHNEVSASTGHSNTQAIRPSTTAPASGTMNHHH